MKRQLISTIDSDAQFVKNEWRATCNVIQCVGKLQTYIFFAGEFNYKDKSRRQNSYLVYITAPICEILYKNIRVHIQKNDTLWIMKWNCCKIILGQKSKILAICYDFVLLHVWKLINSCSCPMETADRSPIKMSKHSQVEWWWGEFMTRNIWHCLAMSIVGRNFSCLVMWFFPLSCTSKWWIVVTKTRRHHQAASAQENHFQFKSIGHGYQKEPSCDVSQPSPSTNVSLVCVCLRYVAS